MPLTDEFNGNELDGKKWSTDPHVVSGPAVSRDFFLRHVRVENGTLKLFAREAHRNASWPEDLTTSRPPLFTVTRGAMSRSGIIDIQLVLVPPE